MKVCRTFISFIFLTLQDANTALCNAVIPTHTGMEGGSITVECSFYVSGRWKLVCKDKCEEKVLIRTNKDAAQRGRYSMTYKEELFPTRHAFLYVSITQLQKSDSGLYRCYLDRRSDPYLYVGFQLNVIEATTSSATIEPKLALQSASPSTTATISRQSEISAVELGFLLPVVISVVLVVLVLSVALICKKKTADSWLNRRNFDKTQIVLYENCPLVSLPEDLVYQRLDAATRDQDQLYFTLRDAKAQLNMNK